MSKTKCVTKSLYLRGNREGSMIADETLNKIVAARDLLTSFLLENTTGGFEEINEVDDARNILMEICEEYDVRNYSHNPVSRRLLSNQHS